MGLGKNSKFILMVLTSALFILMLSSFVQAGCTGSGACPRESRGGTYWYPYYSGSLVYFF